MKMMAEMESHVKNSKKMQEDLKAAELKHGQSKLEASSMEVKLAAEIKSLKTEVRRAEKTDTDPNPALLTRNLLGRWRMLRRLQVAMPKQ